MPLASGSSPDTGYHLGQAGAAAYRKAGKSIQDSAKIRFYAESEISENMAETPEGFLICYNVPIARTGIQLYTYKEVPVTADGAGLVRIVREDDEVFRDEAVASFEGKPVTNDHPPVNVGPENWKEYASGVVQNVRRGAGIDDDLLFADLLITDIESIKAVRDGKREISCGYDAEYEELEPGRGRQYDIVGNHVALVESGRAGIRCSIGDKRSDFMSKLNLKESILKAFRTQDANAMTKALNTLDTEGAISYGEGEEKSQHIHVHVVGASEPQKKLEGEGERMIADNEPMTHGMFKSAMDSYFKAKDEAAAKKVADEAKEAEEKKKAEDAAAADDMCDDDNEEEAEEKLKEKEKEKEKTNDSAKNLRASVEILSPGLKIPTFDGKNAKKITHIKRKALDSAWQSDAGRESIKAFVTDKEPDFSEMPADKVDAVFSGSVALMKALNNRRLSTKDNATGDSKVIDAFARGGIDKLNQNFWNNLNKKGA